MLIKAIQSHAKKTPYRIAIHSGANTNFTYKDLLIEIEKTQQLLNKYNSTIAMVMDNCPAWAVIDFAALCSHTTLIPVPTFFSESQTLHAVEDAGAGVLITDSPERLTKILGDRINLIFNINVAGKKLMVMLINSQPKHLPPSTVKITYTSGTTGQPKGVCLTEEAMFLVAQSIQKLVKLNADDQHLCVLPLSTLLENVAGLYAIFLAGGTAHILPAADIGLDGSSLNIDCLHQALMISKASTAIFTPALLSALVSECEKELPLLNSLRFLAVGGASVSPELLSRANNVGLPVFEGYGLSESASVVALNTVHATKIGSVGKLLPHLSLRIAEDKEVLVKGANYLGYTNGDNPNGSWLNTGDIGTVDDDGYLFINGRKKNIFITSYGRNVSPEWVERDLTSTSEIVQACLFGEGKPWNVAALLPEQKATKESISAAVSRINQQLPDYARVSGWVLLVEPFSIKNNQLTANGRLKRDVIWQAYQAQIEQLYEASNNQTI